MLNIFHCGRRGREQILICGDIEEPSTREALESSMPPLVHTVYSDPPWNPGNATYWRTHAGLGPCESYNRFLDAWCSAASACLKRGASNVFIEQSNHDTHAKMFIDATGRQPSWPPLQRKWTVYYGSPGSAGCRRPNSLLHFGPSPIETDPEGMAGEPMTIRACAGIGAPVGSWIVDPCIGKGMTSRMAVYFDWNCLGCELNPKRLAVTLGWLEKQGYTIRELPC